MADHQTPSPNKKRQYILWGLILTFLFIAILIFIYWYSILRFEQSTNDSYVAGNQIVMTSQISGYVDAIYVNETDVVREGQVLITLDSTDKLINFDEAKQLLANTVRQVVGLFEMVEKLKVEKQIREIEREKAYQDFTHRRSLLEEEAVSTEQYQHAQATYLASIHAVSLVEHELQAAVAKVEKTKVETHPLVEEAKNKVRKAFLDLQRCIITAAAEGVVAQRQAQVGAAITPETPLMFIVPLDQIWVNANFKETQLKYIHVGQPVTLTSDLYGRDIIFHGKVAGLWPGTGSVFSLLPPQNATGNWIKIVQRLPVRIQLDPEELKKYPLRMGLSMTATVDIRSEDKVFVPKHTSQFFYTNIYKNQLEGVEDLIAEIIRNNS